MLAALDNGQVGGKAGHLVPPFEVPTQPVAKAAAKAGPGLWGTKTYCALCGGPTYNLVHTPARYNGEARWPTTLTSSSRIARSTSPAIPVPLDAKRCAPTWSACW